MAVGKAGAKFTRRDAEAALKVAKRGNNKDLEFGDEGWIYAMAVAEMVEEDIDLDQEPNVSNQKLKNIVKALYKGQARESRIGNGTTMDAVRNEIKTGEPTNGKYHKQKLEDNLNALNRRLRAKDLNEHDEQVAKALIDDIEKVFEGK